MKKVLLSLLFGLFAFTGFSQFYNVPASGSDTNTSCVGILRDPGGTGIYPAYSNGFFVIDPPGNQPVQLLFTQFQTFNSSDYVQVYDGVGTFGTLLGTYSGSSIPSPVTSTSGALTVRFYSNCCSSGSGFQATWTASGGNAPIAAFIASPTNVAFNAPVQFFNTSLYAGSYYWDFGDGTSSTDENPAHSYTASGTYDVKLIASNCTSTDTSNITTITVGAAPNGSINPDTLKLTANCGTTANGSFTITNGAGGGNLTYSLELKEKNKAPALSESFENGLGNFSNQSPTIYTVSNQTSGVIPDGSKYLNIIGNGYYFDGVHATIPSTPIKEASYWVKTNTSSWSNTGTVAIGPANMNFNTDAMVYTYFYYGSLRVYYRDQNNFYSIYNTNSSVGQWMHVEYKNIDWNAKTFDVYINNNLVINGARFLNQTITGIEEFDASSYYSGNFDLDGVLLGDKSVVDDITFLPTTGTIGAGSSNVVSVSVNAADLIAGVYNLEFNVQSNDLTLDGTKLPMVLTVVGDAALTHLPGCVQLDTLIQGQSISDSVMVYNTGCDTLVTTSITATDSDISLITNSLNLVPDDTAYIHFTFNPTQVKTYNDSLVIAYSGLTDYICLNGVGLGAPILGIDSTMMNVTAVNCGDSVTVTRTLSNTGNGSLKYSFGSSESLDLQSILDTVTASSSVLASSLSNLYTFWGGTSGSYISDGGNDMYDYGNYLTFDNSNYLYYTQTSVLQNNIVLGNNGQYFTHYGNSIWVFAADVYGKNTFNISGGLGADGLGSISTAVLTQSISGKTYKGFVKRIHNTWEPSVNHLVIVEDIGNTSHTWNASTNYDQHDITGLTSHTRVYYILWGGTSGHLYSDNDVAGLMDSFLKMIHGNSLPDYVSVSPDKGDLAAPGTQSVSFTFKSEGLPTGTYTDTVVLESNQPNNPIVNIPFTFVVSGSPDFYYDTNCHQFDSTFIGGTDTDTIYVFNNGCDSLVVNSSTSSTGYYSVSPSAFTIPAYDSLKVAISYNPTAVGNHSDTLKLVGNDNSAKICVNGVGRHTPVAVLNTPSISASLASCNDSVIVPLKIANTGLGSMDFKVSGSANGQLNILVMTQGSNAIYLQNAKNAIINNIGRPVQITDFTGTTAADLTAALADQDILWLAPNENNGTSQSTTLSTAAQAFVTNGGGFVGSASNYYYTLGNLGIFNYWSGATVYSGITLTVNPTYANHPLMQNLGPTFYGGPSIYTQTFINVGKRQLATYGTNPTDILTEIDYGSGKAIYAGFRFTSSDPVIDPLFANIFNQFGDAGLAPWIKVAPDSGRVAATDSITLNVTLSSTHLTNGTYNDTIAIETNDPSNPVLKVPVTFTVNGPIEFIPEHSCVNFDTTMVGQTAFDSLWVFNPGCDTLKVTSNSSTTNDFYAQPDTFNIAPNDSQLVGVYFNPSVIGTYQDSITFVGNLPGAKMCVSAVSEGAPDFTYTPSSFVFDINTCVSLTDSDSIFLMNINGQGPLDYKVRTAHQHTDTSYIPYFTTGANTIHNFMNTPTFADSIVVTVILNGDFDSGSEYAELIIEGTNLGILPDANTLNYDTIVTVITNQTQITSWLIDGQLDITIDNSSQVHTFSGQLNAHEVIIEVASGSPWLTVGNPTDGTVLAGGTQGLEVSVDATGMQHGTYNTNITITTNDPNNPTVSVPVTLNVISAPDVKVGASCIHFGAVSTNSTYNDSVLIYNDGCAPLDITGLTFNNNDFSTSSASNQTLGVGDSTWINVQFVPTTSGNVNASMLVLNNDSNLTICLTANAAALPTTAFDEIFTNQCDGVVSFTDNTSNNPTQWLWDFGDGYISVAQNPSHTYARPGIYNVKLVSSNLAGSDSLTKSVDVTSMLYVDFVTPDSIFVNTPAQFIDSSQVATGWQWFFGDGASSQIQNPVHTYTNTGVFNVSFIANSATCSKTINRQITVYGNIGIDEFDAKAVNVFPVPSSDHVKITWGGIHVVEHVEIFDGIGRLVESAEISEKDYNVNVSTWADGVYQVKLTNSKGEQIMKQLIVSH
jgi:PKD repeat protein